MVRLFGFIALCVSWAEAMEVAVADTGRNAFSHPLPGLSVESRRAHATGNSFFNQNWVMAPASAASRDGLGPLFNARSCSACHPLDGRGSPDSVSLILRVSMLQDGVGMPHPTYGDQIQTLAIPGAMPDAEITLEWLTEGNLRRPAFHLSRWSAQPPAQPLLLSARVGNAVFGLGLLESVPAAVIEARADPADADGDGISGRVNRVWDKSLQSLQLGRFGWKANQPSLRQQAADAFWGDIGITSPVNRDANSSISDEPELSEVLLQRVTVYLQTLAPPARRDVTDPQVMEGEKLFAQIRCSACHLPELQTGAEAALPELVDQTFGAYTDLLLHDLGPGLADHRPDHEASGQEWRTAPLWGIGLLKTVNNHTTLLHDGRARNIEEAIHWHGGEAEKSKQEYLRLREDERVSLIKFVESL